jgi:glycerol uptake facilitator-like aquaporin
MGGGGYGNGPTYDEGTEGDAWDPARQTYNADGSVALPIKATLYSDIGVKYYSKSLLMEATASMFITFCIASLITQYEDVPGHHPTERLLPFSLLYGALVGGFMYAGNHKNYIFSETQVGLCLGLTLNPAISIMNYVRRVTNLCRYKLTSGVMMGSFFAMVVQIIGQLGGAFAGFAIVWGLTGSVSEVVPTSDTGLSDPQVFVFEFLVTGMIAWVICSDTNKFVVGVILMAAGLATHAHTGGFFNPGFDLGVRWTSNTFPDRTWAYHVGPITGALSAMILQAVTDKGGETELDEAIEDLGTFKFGKSREAASVSPASTPIQMGAGVSGFAVNAMNQLRTAAV